LYTVLTPHDIQRLESYARNQIEYRLILDLTADLSSLHFQNKLPNAQLDALQKAILLGIGAQNKNLDQLAAEFNMPCSQILAKFHDTVKKLTKSIQQIVHKTIENELNESARANEKSLDLKPLEKTMDEELEEEARKLEKKQKKELIKLQKESLAQYAIKGSEDDWKSALNKTGAKSSIISVKSGEKRSAEDAVEKDEIPAEGRFNWNKNKKKKFSGENKKFSGKKDKFFKK
jgi:N-acetyltransferase 10